MKRVDFPLFADLIFYSTAACVLTLCIMRYYRLPFALCIPVSILLSLALALVLFLIMNGRHRRMRLSKREAQEREALMLHLALEREERVRARLVEALTADGKEAHCAGDAIQTEEGVLHARFTMQPLSADAIAQLIKEGEGFSLACNDLSPEAQKLAARFSVRCLKANEIYALFSRTEKMPSPLIRGNLSRRSARQKVRAFFCKLNARPYFISGILLLLMSLFTFFPVYYLVTGSILLLCAVTVRFFGFSA